MAPHSRQVSLRSRLRAARALASASSASDSRLVAWQASDNGGAVMVSDLTPDRLFTTFARHRNRGGS